MIQKRLNTIFNIAKCAHFVGPVIAQIFPELHGLAYKITENFQG